MEEEIEVFSLNDINYGGIPKLTAIKKSHGIIFNCQGGTLFAIKTLTLELVSAIQEDDICTTKYKVIGGDYIHIFEQLDAEICKSLAKDSEHLFGKKYKLLDINAKYQPSLTPENEIEFDIYTIDDEVYPSIFTNQIYDPTVTPKNFKQKYQVGQLFYAVVMLRHVETDSRRTYFRPIFDAYHLLVGAAKKEAEVEIKKEEEVKKEETSDSDSSFSSSSSDDESS